MLAERVDQKTCGRFPAVAGVKAAQEGILDADQPCAAPGRDTLAARCRRAASPDGDAVARAGQAKAQVITGQRQDAAQAAFAQEAAGLEEETPATAGFGRLRQGQFPPLAALSSATAEFAVPVRAPTAFCHWT